MKKIQLVFVIIIANFYLVISCNGHQSNQRPSNEVTTDELREFNKVTQETDKSEENDVWHGSIYRNKKYHLRIQFPTDWEYDKGMSVNTLARAIDRQRGITLSVAIQHLPVEVPDTMDVYESVSGEEFKRSFSRVFEETNSTTIDDLEIERSALNNLPAYLLTATYDLTSMDRTLTFMMKQICCLKESKYYNVQIVLPKEFYDEETAQVFRSFVDSFKFELQ